MGTRVSRRRLLGYGAATAAAVAAHAAPAAAATGDEALRENAFAVEIEGCPEASANVRLVALGGLTVDLPVTGKDRDGYRTYGAGTPRWGATKIALSRGTKGELRSWLEDPKRPRKRISVTIRSKDGDLARSYDLVECFPVSYSEGDLTVGGEANVAELVVQPTRVEAS
ncbi:MAG TPA: hypothetical protein VFM93_08850 [Candidatus Limnocylindria bacterium]|nr:hypothetical protein [Candidatus Limnocylindria bacterium]